MSAPLVECVPNFSEGRDQQTIDALRAAVTGIGDVQLLDVQTDAAHNRSVFTFVGAPDATVEAVFAAMRVARERIDLTKHSGEHPRMGATDVVPFVPVSGATMDDCIALARQLGERVGKELEIPVFLYARAATRPDRVLLPEVRKGEFEGMRGRTLEPDFGPTRVHPTAGATAIGARPFLVAFNVYLDTQDIAIAKEIAKQIRTSSGGLPGVQASGFIVDGLAQVSMNLLDIDITSPAVVFNAIKARAEKRGVGIQRSEIVGLIPERGLIGAAESLLRLSNAGHHILETKIRASMPYGAAPSPSPSPSPVPAGPSLDGWIDELAGGAPTPGGGSAAALAGTLSAALVAMVARLTIGKKAYAAVEGQAREILAEAEQLRAELRRLVDEDAAAYEGVTTAYKIPKSDPGRAAAIDAALLAAARPPAEVVKRGRRLLALAQTIEQIGNKNAVSDARVAGMLARTAIDGATENVNANLAGMSEQARANASGLG
ncbi:MAG TPA: glutamate formimidoyltransferase [Gemmatimonadales bacterium]|jgi:glutamate formiminotransferase/formiminotetrahydrofolate cyclodeaminase